MPRLALQVASSLERDDLLVEITVKREDGGEEHLADAWLDQGTGRVFVDLHRRFSGDSWRFELEALQQALEQARQEAMTFATPVGGSNIPG